MHRFRLKRDHWKHLRIHLPPEAPRNSGLRLRWHSKISSSHQQWRPNPWIIYPTALLLVSGAGLVAYGKFQPFRHIVLASVRCSRVAGWICFPNCVDHTKCSRFKVPRSLEPLTTNEHSRKRMSRKMSAVWPTRRVTNEARNEF
jgi:hypothetical protein